MCDGRFSNEGHKTGMIVNLKWRTNMVCVCDYLAKGENMIILKYITGVAI